MYFSDEILLIAVTYKTDDAKNQIVDKTEERSVYADLKSVTQTEFFAGAQEGMKDQIRVDMRVMDYRGERIARVGSKLYDVYRTFQSKPDVLELYFKESGNGKKLLR